MPKHSINIRSVLHVLSVIITSCGLFMILPLGFAYYYGDGDAGAILVSMLITIAAGSIIWILSSGPIDLRIREGFVIVTFGWLLASVFGALPFLLSGSIHSFVDAFFETVSGFTTTGATILTDIERLPHGILFWRSLTHWLGGMGIIVLSLAILPLLGVGGMQLFKAEVPGPVHDKLTPRMVETARILWGVYVILSLVETGLLMLGGMSLFEALCHTFGTMATGGFSTKNASIGHYNSLYIDLVIITFMFIAGTNFTLHYHAFTGKIRAYWRDREFLFYSNILLIMIIIISASLIITGRYPFGQALRYGVFQVVSITTTTGYGTADFELWSKSSQLILLLLMFVGGCAGSTGGSVKILRIMLVIKHANTELKKLVHPNAVIPVRIGDKPIAPEVVTNILAFFLLYIFIFAAGSVLMAAMGLDLVSAIASVAATLGNIGPGLGTIGPTDNYAHIPLVGKLLLTFFMLLGRLELYTVLVLFTKSFWRK